MLEDCSLGEDTCDAAEELEWVRRIFRKYVRHVEDCEGTNFIDVNYYEPTNNLSSLERKYILDLLSD